VVAKQKKAANPQRLEYIAEWLPQVDVEKLAQKFDSSVKVKKTFNRKSYHKFQNVF
jgi:hypothetical protein